MQPNPESFGKVAVVFGGWSAEREVSLKSGAEVLAALQQCGVDAHPVDADRQVAELLVSQKFDRAFLVLHGRGGEDGSVQAALELAGIPYTGSGVLGSALAMDKLRAKQICAFNGIRTARWHEVASYEQAREAAAELHYPVIVKPVLEGSSIGVSKAMENELTAAYENASAYGPVMMEEFIDGLEVTASILGDRALPLISMSTPNLFYDYEAKYLSDDTNYQCPVDLPEADQRRIQKVALMAFKAIGAKDWARVDFMLDQQGNEYFMELNTAPGMTDHSLVPMAAREAGIQFPQLCLQILSATLTVKSASQKPMELV